MSTAYGWFLLAGLGVSLAVWMRLARRDERLLPIYLGALLGAFTGAKLLYLAAEGWNDWGRPDLWRRWATGKTILGALAGGYAGVELAKRLVGYAAPTGDGFALVAPIGILLGRVGCLLHGCCLGRACEAAWWALPDRAGVPRWPAVPAEIAFNLAALAAALALRARGLLPGQHFHLYLVAYGIFRFAHETVRDTPRLAGPASGYQIAALALAAFGLWRFAQRRRRQHIHPITDGARA